MSVKMLLLEENGRFWWYDDPIPDEYYTQSSAITGRVKIYEDGRIELDLYGLLSVGQVALSEMTDKPYKNFIHGMLFKNNQYIFLGDLSNSRIEHKPRGKKFKNYRARWCLIGKTPLKNSDILQFKKMEIELGGLEKWFGLTVPHNLEAAELVKHLYEEHKNVEYDVDDEKITLASKIIKILDDENSVKFLRIILFIKELPDALNIQSLEEEVLNLENLITALTNNGYLSDWPFAHLQNGNFYRFYFHRVRYETPEQDWRDYPLTFSQIRENFGSVLSGSKAKKMKFGAAFGLYFSTRRDTELYAENRFTNLVWGIEVFHRQKFGSATPANPNLSAKIERILNRVERRDKKWLKDKLKLAHEPSLADRIFQVFENLPLRIDSTKLREFAERCAGLRNDISHHGGTKTQTAERKFIDEVVDVSGSLSCLFHALILHEIGIEDAIIERWIYDGNQSHEIGWHFIVAGLAERDVVNYPID